MKTVRPQQPIKKVVKPQAVEERRQLIEEHTKLCQEEGLYDNTIKIENCSFDVASSSYVVKVFGIAEPIIVPIKPEDFEQEDNFIDNLMQETQQEIDSDKIKVEFTLTKRQYDLWVKKGAERWVKKALIGQKLTKKR